MSELGTELTIAREADGLVLSGEIDAHTAPDLERSIAERLNESPTIRLDLSEVTFMDSSGLRTLIGATNEARERGGDLVLHAPTTAVFRLIEISGLATHLHLTAAS